MYKVVSGSFEFWLNGNAIFVRYNGRHISIVYAKDNRMLKPHEYAELCDKIYRRKLKDSDGLYYLMGKYKLTYTSRRLK